MASKTSKKQKPYTRTGKTIAGGRYAYPKRYEILVTSNGPQDVKISRTNENFNGWELYGHLRMVLLDLERQLGYSTEPSSELLEKRTGDNHAQD